MKKFYLLSLSIVSVLALSGLAYAGQNKGNELAYFGIPGLTTLAAASVTTGDFIPVYDASAAKVKKVPAETLPLGGAFNGTVGADTPAAGTFTTLQANTSLKVNATTGTAVTQLIVVSDAVASGQTSKTVTVTGATASSLCFAAPAEVATSAVYIRAVVPGTNQVVVTTSADPGASNLDIKVLCLN